MIGRTAATGFQVGIRRTFSITPEQAWVLKEWEKPSTLQFRLISDKPDRTTVSFHHENLDQSSTREQMKQHWEKALIQMSKINLG